MKSFLLTITSVFCVILLQAQSLTLPLKEWKGKLENTFVFYITGDGGFNNFSNDLGSEISKSGYETIALNAKSYFWDKKSPRTVASEISKVISEKLHTGKYDDFILIGYSFGADVMPFIENEFSAEIRSKLKSVILLSPSSTTDFQIRLMDMFGKSAKRSMDVLSAINQMHVPKMTIFFGSDEKDFPTDKIHLKNIKVIRLPGGHHYEGNIKELSSVVIHNF